VLEAFTPDFYLPEAEIYVECTTAQPSLMARKRRKVRKARELHDLVITLHERHDFERFRRRYADWKAKRS
jgi:hypoxanthine phosphoribosyltransferase